MRSSPPFNGFGPCIQVRRMPFLSRMVVMVAVETARSVVTSSEDIGIPDVGLTDASP